MPNRIALFESGSNIDYRGLRQEWVLYQSSYFDVAGPPRREDWHYDEILQAIPSGASLGFVPDLAHFHPGALRLHAVRQGSRHEVRRLGQWEDSSDQLASVDFVVGKSGFQGVSYITRFNHRVYRKLEELGWLLLRTWKMPDQSQGHALAQSYPISVVVCGVVLRPLSRNDLKSEEERLKSPGMIPG